MEIYKIEIDEKKYSQYKTYEDAKKDLIKLINTNKNSNIKIIMEEFYDYGIFDNCCKIYLLCEYLNFVIREYIKYKFL